MRQKQRRVIDFSRGIDAWNRESAQATSIPAGFTAAQPHQLRECPPGYVDDILNMVFDREGKLIGRNPVTNVNMGSGNFPNTGDPRQGWLITHPAHTSGKDSIGSFLIATYDLATQTVCKFFRNGLATNTFTHTFASAIDKGLFSVYYNDFWWIFSSRDTHDIAKVSDISAITTVNHTWPEASMTGNIRGMTIFKDRAFAWAFNTLGWSKATDPGVWTIPDGGFVKIAVSIQDVAVFNDSLYILGSDNSIYVLSYTDDPSTDGVVRKVIEGSSMPGGVFGNLAVSNGELYATGASNVYRILNNNPVPIADSLHLEVNAHTDVKIWDCGEGILLRTYYNVSNADKTQDIFYYSHSADAWTRITFPIYGAAADTAETYIDQAHLRVQNNYVNLTMVFQGGSTVNGTFAPPMDFWITYPNFDISYHDRIISVFNGTGSTLEYSPIRHRLSTGPIYPEDSDSYKRFWSILFEAYLGWWNSNGSNAAPYRVLIEFIPEALADLNNDTMNKSLPTTQSAIPYVFPINQRARGVRITWETEDFIVWTTEQNPDDNAEASDYKPFINRLEILYDTIGRRRFQAPGLELTTSRNV